MRIPAAAYRGAIRAAILFESRRADCDTTHIICEYHRTLKVSRKHLTYKELRNVKSPQDPLPQRAGAQ
jgi:hypothetical protein